MQNMETRYTHSPEDIRHYSTEELRREFLVEKFFIPGKISLTYTHNDWSWLHFDASNSTITGKASRRLSSSF